MGDSMARFCESCGKEMGDAAMFCPSCGKAATLPEPGGAGTGAGGQSADLQRNLVGALAYLWIPAIFFLLVEPYNRDKFVRFHSFQALFLGLAAIAGHVVLSVIPIIGWTLIPLWSLLVVVVALIAAVKAYQNQTWSIPVIGPYAVKQV
jgi:uncharacterized membrane protein